ncbi:hypothetical protein BDQ17DRAFT_1340293 [Cyathus striatus]|nr:hypothetical protein BDQ17DRAFT_1340293 [Cyathus striatus]
MVSNVHIPSLNIHYVVPLPLADQSSWFYPAVGYNSDEDEIQLGTREGNWGRKTAKGARWIRRGKMAAWGPGVEEWEVEERTRKRIKLLLPQDRRSPSPPTLPHLSRSPSPPITSPYPPPTTSHLSYTSFVMDKAVTHTFRSHLLDELEHATNGLIEGEATLRAALGRLWQVMNIAPDEQDDRERRLARAPDLTPPTHKLFLLNHPNISPPVHEPSHFASPQMQMEMLEKSLATLRELQDDGREYVERLQEIRETLGDVRAQRNTVWDVVRGRAIKELQDAAYVSVGM